MCSYPEKSVLSLNNELFKKIFCTLLCHPSLNIVKMREKHYFCLQGKQDVLSAIEFPEENAQNSTTSSITQNVRNTESTKIGMG